MPDSNFDPSPLLQTTRLCLKALQKQDRTQIFELHTNEAVLQYLNRQPAVALSEADAFIQKILSGTRKQRWFYWGIHLADEPDHLIGTICLWQFSEDRTSAEIGFELLPAYQGQGLMSEAVEVVIQFAKARLPLKHIEATVQAENKASIGLLSKFGFSFHRSLAEEEKYSGEKGIEILAYTKPLENK